MNKHAAAIGTLVFSGCLSSSAIALPIVPTFDRFGPLTEATWGGSGIPNDAVAITEITTEICTTRCRPVSTVTLGLSSHGRYENLLEGNDGAGTFSASAGSNTPPSSSSEGATWNFNFFVDVEGSGQNLSLFDFNLYYDFDPAVGNDASTHGVINLNDSLAFNQVDPATETRLEGSQNLLFGFLGAPLPFLVPPSGVTNFDPNAAGEYSFALTAVQGGRELGRSAMRVVVNSVPVPASLLLIATGLLLLGARYRLR